MVLGFGGRVHGRQNQLFLTLETPRDFNKDNENYKSCLGNMMFGFVRILEIDKFKMLEKTRTGNLGGTAWLTLQPGGIFVPFLFLLLLVFKLLLMNLGN